MTAKTPPVIRLKNTNVTNKTNAKALALEFAKKFRTHKFTRVSAEFLEDFERASREWILQRVQSHGKNPSKGVTLR